MPISAFTDFYSSQRIKNLIHFCLNLFKKIFIVFMHFIFFSGSFGVQIMQSIFLFLLFLSFTYQKNQTMHSFFRKALRRRRMPTSMMRLSKKIEYKRNLKLPFNNKNNISCFPYFPILQNKKEVFNFHFAFKLFEKYIRAMMDAFQFVYNKASRRSKF